MGLKLNNADNYEPITIILDKKNTPIAYNNKIEELVEQKLYPTIKEAERLNPTIRIDCEIYYHKHYGVFAVEEGACESGTVYSPYSGELLEDADENKI